MTTEMQPPRTSVGVLGWLRQNLFSTWYNTLLTFLGVWLIVSLARPAIVWNMTAARWGVIEANLTLFMVGQYPRDQLWRIWLTLYMLGGLIGLSWGVWKNAARAFAFIALGASAGFALITVLLGWDTWMRWTLCAAILLALYFIGQRLPRGGTLALIGWLVYFPLVLLIIAGSKYIPALPPVSMSDWGGLLLTLILTVVGNIGSLPFGILLAIGRRSTLPVVKAFCVLYIEVIRGVPLVTILYMAAILLSLFLPENIVPHLVIRAMIGLIMFEAAYQAENVRGGLQAIPRGQFEAAQALGLNGTLTMGLIILPQALRAVIPALFNSFVSLFKDTSLVAIISLFELLRIGRSVLAQTEWLGTHIEVFMFAFVVYLGINLAFSYGARRVEGALGVGKR